MKIERLVLAAAIAIATPVAPIGAAVAQTDTAPRGEAKGGPRTDGIVVFNGLNKITARIVELDAPIGKPIEFGALVITPRACQKAPPEEPPEAGGVCGDFRTQAGRSAAAALLWLDVRIQPGPVGPGPPNL